MSESVKRIDLSDPGYPSAIEKCPAVSSIDTIGNLDILNNFKVALFCSSRCPVNLIISAQSLAYQLRDEGKTVILGGHSPVEKECQRVLLNGSQPLVICPARSIEKMRIPSAWKRHLENGRLLVLSPFKEGQPRMTAKLAWERNLFMAKLADEIIIIHASANSKTMKLAEAIAPIGKPIYTLDDEDNERLLEMGFKKYYY